MIDAFRKDFLRSEADWQAERKKFGRNRFGSETLSFFFFFFESTRSGNSRRRSNKEPVENLAAILLHWRTPFPAVHHYLPSSSFPTDIPSLVFSIPYPSPLLSVCASFPFLSRRNSDQASLNSETSLISVSSNVFPFTKNTSTRVVAYVTDPKGDRERWQ